MAVSDIYTFSATVTLAATTATPALSVVMPVTLRGWVVGIRLKVGLTLAANGNDILVQLCRPGNTPTGTTTTAGVAHDFSAPAAVATGYTAWSTAPTVGTLLIPGHTVPQTTGSEWEEFPPTNYEWGIPAIANGSANNGVHVFLTATVNTSTPVTVDLIMSE